MSVWLYVIGVTEAGVASLPKALREVIVSAETVLCPKRMVEQVPEGPHVIEWEPPLAVMLETVKFHQGRKTVILASGDPTWFGIGATLVRELKSGEFAIHPAASSFQFAAARMKWPLQNVATLSLHGRDPAGLQPHILPGHRILALTSDAATLDQVAQILVGRGYGPSVLTILENLGGSDENVTICTAETAGEIKIGDFYVLAIDCVAEEGARLIPPVPGLPDEAFQHDGQLTKREVRASTIAKLAPFPKATLWDVGAGCGSVAIEWMRAAARAKAICFERDKQRIGLILKNRQALGAPDLKILQGDALTKLGDAPDPDAVFLGGDVANEDLFEACFDCLKPGGRLVANAVTLGAERALYARQEKFGGELARIEVSVLDQIGEEKVMRPRMAVTQWVVVK